jgi:hypothetical protein
MGNGAVMGWGPPNPCEVTEVGVPLTWAWLLGARDRERLSRLKSATEAGSGCRTGISYSSWGGLGRRFSGAGSGMKFDYHRVHRGTQGKALIRT